jgi:rRNA maturation endonuclease Nob1
MKAKASKLNSLHAKTKDELKRRIKRKYRSGDAHRELYKKEYHEVIYKHMCPICGSRIDENGMCACGAGDS